MVMKFAVHQSHGSGLALSDGSLLSELLGMPSELVTISFRGTWLQVLAAQDPAARVERPAAPGPVTDPLHLELLSGCGEAPGWRRPVALHAVIECRADPALAVRNASRWASYAARVAVVPQERLNDRALLEAELRGVWVVVVSDHGELRIVVRGEQGPVEGSMRGLAHRLLDELIWAALLAKAETAPPAATSAATQKLP
jgi:hypothetical protein